MVYLPNYTRGHINLEGACSRDNATVAAAVTASGWTGEVSSDYVPPAAPSKAPTSGSKAPTSGSGTSTKR